MGWTVLMRALLLLVALGSAGCLRTTEFKCTSTADCSESGAVCESTNYCSFADTSCSSGRRYGGLSGSYANQCVGGEGGDGGIDSDGGGDSCPTGYATLSGAGTHKYKKIGNAAIWSTQRDRCAADATGGAMTYLAVPDDTAEAMAIVGLSAAAKTWVGVNDLVTEGTYMTVLNTTASFLPWDTGVVPAQPDDANPGEDCVSAVTASGLYYDDKCSLTFVAVCECQ